jgi:digeranylgeranylglycerophospholipid reductase
VPIPIIQQFPYIKDIDAIESYSYGGTAHSTSLQYNLEIQTDKPLVAMVLRKKFDNALVTSSKESGAHFIDGKKVEDLKITSDHAELRLQDGTCIQSDIVIGADGIWSTIAKQTGLCPRHDSIGIAVYEEYPLNAQTMDEFFTEKRLCHLHVKLQGLAGYGWVFPKKHHVNIGLGEFRFRNAQHGKNLKEAYRTYLGILKNQKIIPRDLRITKLQGGALPTWPLEKTYTDRLVLCGDAAGVINPISGEGIHYAMISGRIAAEVIAEAVNAADFSAQFLSKYQQRWHNDFGRDINLMVRLAKHWGDDSDAFIRRMTMDKKLADLCLAITIGQISIYENRWKLIPRYLYATLRDRVRINK